VVWSFPVFPFVQVDFFFFDQDLGQRIDPCAKSIKINRFISVCLDPHNESGNKEDFCCVIVCLRGEDELMFNAVVRIIWINVVGFSMMRNTTKPPLSEPWGSKVKDGELSQSVFLILIKLKEIFQMFGPFVLKHFNKY